MLSISSEKGLSPKTVSSIQLAKCLAVGIMPRLAKLLPHKDLPPSWFSQQCVVSIDYAGSYGSGARPSCCWSYVQPYSQSRLARRQRPFHRHDGGGG